MGSSGVKDKAFANYGTNSTNAANALGTINPIYSKLATGTVGYTPQQKANQLTASEQSGGGGVASAVGQGGLMAARTGNAGAATAALDDASRNAVAQQSSDALGVQNRSDDLATQNQRVGLSGLNSIYSGANQQADASLNTANQAAAPFWQSALLAGISGGSQVGAAAMGKPPCWIAAELYGGWDEPRTVAIRGWLVGDFSDTAFGRFIVKIYVHYGAQMAERIRSNKPLRWIFQMLFDRALRQAVK